MSVASTGEPRILSRPDHPVSRRNIDVNALKVLYRLHHAGFKSYLVGGAVRDLMLERRPKDFDISTDARPQQIRRLFRNSRIIGRRFRLAHIYFREGIVEVSTFRRSPDPQTQDCGPGELLITDDNAFGSPEEDAYRRDFTVNALFYNVSDFSIIDYVGGIDDLNRRLIRTLGPPDVRFREDPVRMLRACELVGRLGLELESETEAAIRRQRREIEKASPTRLSEEIGQILHSGSCQGVLQRAKDVGLLEDFLPEAYTLLTLDSLEAVRFSRVPEVLDGMIAGGRPLSDATVIGSLLLPPLLLRRKDVEALNQRPISRASLRRLTTEVVDSFASRFTLPRAKAEQLNQAFWAFHRLGERWHSVANRVQFSRSPGFDDALDLLEVMVTATGEGQAKLDLWRRIRSKRPEPSARKRPTRRPRRRRRQRRPR